MTQNLNFDINNAPYPKLDSCSRVDGNTWCGDYEQLDTVKYVSINQELVGKKVHPRTLIAPIIIPPTHNLDYWKKDGLSRYFTKMNRPRQQDLYLSGYLGEPCVTNIHCDQMQAPVVKEDFQVSDTDSPSTANIYPNAEYTPINSGYFQSYEQNGGLDAMKSYAETTAQDHLTKKFARETNTTQDIGMFVNQDFIQNTVDGGYQDPFRESCSIPTFNPSFTNPDIKNSCKWNCNPPLKSIPHKPPFDALSKLDNKCSTGSCNKVVENFAYGQENMETMSNSYPYSNQVNVDEVPRYPYYDTGVEDNSRDIGDEFVNTECGTYDPDAPRHGLQVNRCVGPAQKDDKFTPYNMNQSTQIVQPGMYFTSEVIDPINSNIGISYSQQFNPQTAKNIAPGQVLYTDHDAHNFVGKSFQNVQLTGEELENIYDPRYTGYASNDRYYIDEITGQPRFFYDDIDGVKRPSYIVRSNVDHIGCFDQTGAMKHGKLDYDYRSTANTEFHESTLDLRSDIQTRLAQINYPRTVQLRDMPLSNTGRLRGR